MQSSLLLRFYLLTLGGLARLPLSCLYRISNGLAWFMIHCIHYRRNVIRHNLHLVFPEASERERENMMKAYYRHFCDLVVEIVKLLHISKEEMWNRVEAHGTELADQYAREGHPVFVLMGHYGNWEWAQQMYRHFIENIRCTQIYRPAHDPAGDELLKHVRAHFDSTCIPQKAAVRTILRMRKEKSPFLVAFLADQHPNSEVMNHWAPFLGQDSAYITGPEEIGRKVDARYIYLDIEKTSRGHYRMTCHPIEPAPNEEFPISISYLRMMERSIRRQPELWLWSHRRWYITHEEYNQKYQL